MARALLLQRHGVDGRVKPGHDGGGVVTFGLRPPRNDNEAVLVMRDD
jgi:hypothetical protein